MDLSRLLPGVRFTVRHPWVAGARFRVHARRDAAYWRKGPAAYEPHVARLLLAECRPEWFVVEVGAHVGFFTLLLASRTRRVLAFEPDARNREALAANLALNGVSNVSVVAAACGASEGDADFVSDARSGSAGGLASSHHGEHAGPAFRVAVERLDRHLERAGLPAPDLVKIDAEGAEDAVLEGIGGLLDGPTRVLVEVNEATKRAVHDRLRAHGYALANPHDRLRALPPGTYAGWHVYGVKLSCRTQ
jgi:FkbM family methyltransferase